MGAVLVSSLQWERFTGGHSSLVERCRGENQVVVVSIFINPSQFNDPSDLERYPRPIDQDLAPLQSLGVDEVIVPSVRRACSGP